MREIYHDCKCEKICKMQKKKRKEKKPSSALFAQMADKSESGSLEIEQFVQFYKMLTQRDEVWKVFQDYSADGEKLLLDELENFLRIEQQEGEQSSKHAPELIARYEPSDTGRVKTAGTHYNDLRDTDWTWQRIFQ